MSMTEPFIDTELPCSRNVRRSRIRDGSCASVSRFIWVNRGKWHSDSQERDWGLGIGDGRDTDAWGWLVA